MPPLTGITWPVIQADLSDNKKQAVSAMSPGWPMRCKGWRLSADSIFSYVCANAMVRVPTITVRKKNYELLRPC